MSLNIKSAETDRLVRELAAETGETITDAVTVAVAERLERVRRRNRSARRLGLAELRRRVSEMPRLDEASDDVLLDYDDDGVFS